MDRILINDLSYDCVIGILPEERTRTQKVRLSATLELDLKMAGRSGKLEDTVDYYALSQRIVQRSRELKCGLLEELGEKLCEMILEYGQVRAVTLRILKPEAVTQCAGCGIEITRTAADLRK